MNPFFTHFGTQDAAPKWGIKPHITVVYMLKPKKNTLFTSGTGFGHRLEN
ncbi:hypothetical protein [Mongoliitalea daihaiensis]|nr:hypothetical protein [Mongoliitalea daihaiensis]UJP63761.1 hypothetical protein IPZ59_13085 [Mongoliitalea daihaiensis]